MKIVLIIGCSVIIGLGSMAYLTGPVDPIGSYTKDHNNTKIILDVLYLNADYTFIYQYSFFDGITETRLVRGKYEITGKKLKLSAKEFETVSYPLVAEQKSIAVQKGSGMAPVSATVHPEQFKKLLCKFEAGSSRLKPVYFFKRTKGKLSLCLKNVKTGRLTVEFVRKKTLNN